MKKHAAILFATLVIAVCAKAQTVITSKGTKIALDTGQWMIAGGNIHNKNTGNVGIGTNGTINSNAALEVKATNKGMLIPRVALGAKNTATPLSAHVEGMLVYNTATSGTVPNNVTPGFYYNTGSTWRRISDESTEGTVVGDSTNDSWKNDAANNLVKLAYRSNGTGRAVGTEVTIGDNGRLGLGTAAPSWMLDVQGASAIGQVKRIISGTAGLGPGFLFTRARGTPGAETDINNNDVLGKVQFRGSISGNDEDYAALRFVATSKSPRQGYFGFTDSALTTDWMVIRNDNGYVGIGTGANTPDAPLHVNGSPTITTPSGTRTYFSVSNSSGALSRSTSTATSNVQVHANGWFWADGGGFTATSDARIKSIIGRTNTAKDLEILNRIRVTDYTFIDKIRNSPRPQKKVIAQQLRDVFPAAVNESKGVIPDVFETAVNSEVIGNSTRITTGKAHGFKTGDIVKLVIDGAGEKMLTVAVVDERTFSIEEPVYRKIFVYGKKVNDLLSVDYDAVSMLNVAATQELSKQLTFTQEKMERLEAENKRIAADNNELREILAGMQQQIDKLKKNSTN